ncbi:MAG: 5'-nucleotidase C-terminal domain-containing protein [Ilumatobacteraceae bacterium]
MMRSRFAIVALAGLVVGTTNVGVASAERDKPPIEIQILHLSDWHGQLDPLPVGSPAVDIGGAAAISSYFRADRASNPLTLTFTGGDAFGATPPLSNFFLDEPAVKALNLMGLTADTFGNHNFDRGIAHLQTMVDLATYDFVSSNFSNLDSNLSGVASPFKIYVLDKVKVAVIGITNEEAPTLVFPGNFGTMVPTDSVVAAMAARAAAREQGASVFIAIAHKGVTGVDGSGNASGPLIDFANAVTGFDLILGDHTDAQYQGRHNGALVVEELSHGLGYGKIQLLVSQTRGRHVISSSVQFVTPVTSAAPNGPDQAIVDMLAPYRVQLDAVFKVVSGQATKAIPRSDSCGNSAGRTCESLIGDVVTDAMRATYGTDFAITNSGGLRASLTCPASGNAVCNTSSPPPYDITNGQVFAVLPFGNLTTTVTVTGAMLKAILENGVSAMPAINGKYAQVSGLCFTYDIASPVGSRLTGAVRQAVDGSCTGAAVDLTTGSSYFIAENDFMALGGDGYPNIYATSVTQAPLYSVLNDYVASSSPLDPSLQGRITCADTNGATAPNCPVALP